MHAKREKLEAMESTASAALHPHSRPAPESRPDALTDYASGARPDARATLAAQAKLNASTRRRRRLSALDVRTYLQLIIAVRYSILLLLPAVSCL